MYCVTLVLFQPTLRAPISRQLCVKDKDVIIIEMQAQPSVYNVQSNGPSSLSALVYN